MDEVWTEGSARADGDGPAELLFGDGLVRQRVHSHGDLEVVQVVEEEAEVAELLKCDALSILKTY